MGSEMCIRDSSKILALFLGLYLGFTFLLAAAAVLALQQLSQAADNQKRYAMLRRLGADACEVKSETGVARFLEECCNRLEGGDAQ